VNKKSKNKKLKEAREAHAKFLASFGISTPTKRRKRIQGNVNNFPDLSVPVKCSSMSDSIPSNGIRKSIDDYKWKRTAQESQEAIREAEKKKARIAPYINKGAYMYITDEEDKKSLGRKM